jgi:hypothetical protein
MRFSLVIEARAIQDIQQAIDYYDSQQEGLGRRFEKVEIALVPWRYRINLPGASAGRTQRIDKLPRANS